MRKALILLAIGMIGGYFWAKREFDSILDGVGVIEPDELD